MGSFYFPGSFEHSVPQACLVDIVAPTGGAISALANNPDGSLKVDWPAATDLSNPIRYEVYVQEATAVGLFAIGNIVAISNLLTQDVYRDGAGNPIIQGRTYHVGVRAVDAVGNRNTNTTSLSIIAAGIGYANLLSLIPGKVWDELTASHIVAGSFGLQQSQIQTDTTTILSRLTLARANLLDNLTLLDVAVSSRLATAGYTAPDNAGISTLLGRLTAIRAGLLDNLSLLDAAISTRASASALATVNSNVLLTELESDALARYNQIISDIAAIPVVTPPSAGAIADAVWDEATAGHVAAGSFGLAVQSPALDPQDVADAVWDAALVDHADPGTFGENAQNPSLDPTDVADAVWDALVVDHDDAGTFGANAQNPPVNAAQIADAVWDEPLVGHLTLGTTGEALKKAADDANNFELEGTVEDGDPLISGTVEETIIVGTVLDDDIV